MKKLYCVISGKYRRFKNPKIPYILELTLVLSLLLALSVKNEYGKIFKEEELIGY